MTLKWKKTDYGYKADGSYWEYQIHDKRDEGTPGWEAMFKQHGGWVWMSFGVKENLRDTKKRVQFFEDDSIDQMEASR